MRGEEALSASGGGRDRQLLRGDAAAARAEQLVQRYADCILRLSYTYLHSAQDAEDICQETLLKALRRQEPFESEEHERAWVLRVAMNACKDMLRRSRLRSLVSLEDAPELVAPRVQSEAPEQGRMACALDAVMRLPASLRIAIYLRYYEEYEVRDIARALGCTEAAVAARLSRGRRRLRGMLKGVVGDEFDF